jgi:spermidine synthase
MADTQVDASAFDSPFVFSADGHKSLYFTLDQLQSRMCSAHPDQLEVDYTRTMMGFLLFNSRPARIAMIGLGGGSLLKFCYRHLPNTQLTMVEINPKVIALRHEFEVPEDAQRIELVCADGADFVRAAAANNPIGYDVLLVDGFDSEGLAPSLCSQRFYNDCYQALSQQGVMVANLHHDDPKHARFTARIRLAFDGNLLEVASQEKSNSILFARKGSPISIDEIRQSNPLKNFDQEVRTQLQREFARISWAATQIA